MKDKININVKTKANKKGVTTQLKANMKCSKHNVIMLRRNKAEASGEEEKIIKDQSETERKREREAQHKKSASSKTRKEQDKQRGKTNIQNYKRTIYNII
jgi:septal ring factor EnvC (AmiA/AmiB activator)